MRVRRLVPPAVIAPLIVALFAPAPAVALAAPAVYLKELDAGDIPIGDWIPLDGAALHSANGYELGVALQATGESTNRQRILVKVTSVPDGHPDQPNVYSLCIPVTGEAGQIVMPDEHIHYEGDGTYGVAVTVTTGSDETAGCEAGPTATGAFTVTAPSSVGFRGHLLLMDPRNPQPFSGVQVAPPPGSGSSEVLCARDPQSAADGSLTGSATKTTGGSGFNFAPVKLSSDGIFKTVGRWACVARGSGGGNQPGPWSAPTPTRDVQKGFYIGRPGTERLRDFRGPAYRLTERTDPLTEGGMLTLTLKQDGRRATSRVRARIGHGGRTTINFRLPSFGHAASASFLGSMSFAGTRWVAPRSPFIEIALVATRMPNGRVDVEFPAPCAPHVC